MSVNEAAKPQDIVYENHCRENASTVSCDSVITDRLPQLHYVISIYMIWCATELLQYFLWITVHCVLGCSVGTFLR